MADNAHDVLIELLKKLPIEARSLPSEEWEQHMDEIAERARRELPSDVSRQPD